MAGVTGPARPQYTRISHAHITMQPPSYSEATGRGKTSITPTVKSVPLAGNGIFMLSSDGILTASGSGTKYMLSDLKIKGRTINFATANLEETGKIIDAFLKESGLYETLQFPDIDTIEIGPKQATVTYHDNDKDTEIIPLKNTVGIRSRIKNILHSLSRGRITLGGKKLKQTPLQKQKAPSPPQTKTTHKLHAEAFIKADRAAEKAQLQTDAALARKLGKAEEAVVKTEETQIKTDEALARELTKAERPQIKANKKIIKAQVKAAKAVAKAEKALAKAEAALSSAIEKGNPREISKAESNVQKKREAKIMTRRALTSLYLDAATITEIESIEENQQAFFFESRMQGSGRKDGSFCRGSDIRSVADGRWLSGRTIDTYSSLLEQSSGHCFLSTEMSRFTSDLPASFLGTTSLFEHEKNFMPVLAGNNHWALAVIEPGSHKISYYDTLRPQTKKGAVKHMAGNLIPAARPERPLYTP
jgi:hypothetical protein